MLLGMRGTLPPAVCKRASVDQTQGDSHEKASLDSTLIAAALALPAWAQTGGTGSAAAGGTTGGTAGSTMSSSQSYGGSSSESMQNGSPRDSGGSMDQTDVSGGTSGATGDGSKHHKKHRKHRSSTGNTDDRGNPPSDSANPGGDSK